MIPATFVILFQKIQSNDIYMMKDFFKCFVS